MLRERDAGMATISLVLVRVDDVVPKRPTGPKSAYQRFNWLAQRTLAADSPTHGCSHGSELGIEADLDTGWSRRLDGATGLRPLLAGSLRLVGRLQRMGRTLVHVCGARPSSARARARFAMLVLADAPAVALVAQRTPDAIDHRSPSLWSVGLLCNSTRVTGVRRRLIL
jgi:hypothetical protein